MVRRLVGERGAIERLQPRHEAHELDLARERERAGREEGDEAGDRRVSRVAVEEESARGDRVRGDVHVQSVEGPRERAAAVERVRSEVEAVAELARRARASAEGAALLEEGDPASVSRESSGGDEAGEAAADDQGVEVGVHGVGCSFRTRPRGSAPRGYRAADLAHRGRASRLTVGTARPRCKARRRGARPASPPVELLR